MLWQGRRLFNKTGNWLPDETGGLQDLRVRIKGPYHPGGGRAVSALVRRGYRQWAAVAVMRPVCAGCRRSFADKGTSKTDGDLPGKPRKTSEDREFQQERTTMPNSWGQGKVLARFDKIRFLKPTWHQTGFRRNGKVGAFLNEYRDRPEAPRRLVGGATS